MIEKGAEDLPAMNQIKEHYPDSVHRRIYNQIKRFGHEMKIGDIVVIPSSASNHLAFGVINSDSFWYDEPISDDEIEEGVCPYRKRRNVSWFKHVDKHRIDPYLYQFFRSQHAISDATAYADHIDRTIHDFYIKGEEAHLVLGVETTNKIPAISLINLVGGLLTRIDEFDDAEIKSKDVDIKVNVQSPGVLELVSNVATIGLLALIIIAIFSGATKFKKNADNSIEAEASTPGLPGLIDKIMDCYERYQQQQRLNNAEMLRIMNSMQIKKPGDNDDRDS